MANFTIIRSTHLNHQGYRFGATMLRWADEQGHKKPLLCTETYLFRCGR